MQIEVARIQDAHKTAMLNLSDAGMQSLGQARQLEADYWMQLEQLLTPEQLFEYSLRESGLAQQMRAMQFDWSADEFREVYKIRSEQGRSANPVNPLSGQNIYNEEIKTYLGKQRYEDYILAADHSLNRFKQIRQIKGLRVD